MLGNVVSRIAAPSPGACEMREARQTNTAKMIIAAGVEERPAADVTQGMSNELDLRPTRTAQVFSIAAVDPAAARTATGRIKPVNQPIKSIR
jgi:hypothetical protein